VRTLRIAAVVEAVSVVALLGNLATVHVSAIASVLGPLHGTAYLVVIALTWSSPAAGSSGARWPAVVPGIGGPYAGSERTPSKRIDLR
jgi:hypothetical protein